MLFFTKDGCYDDERTTLEVVSSYLHFLLAQASRSSIYLLVVACSFVLYLLAATSRVFA